MGKNQGYLALGAQRLANVITFILLALECRAHVGPT